MLNRVGKFEMLSIVNAIDAALIERFGKNMLDAKITRQEALEAYDEKPDPREAAELLGQRKGFS